MKAFYNYILCITRGDKKLRKLIFQNSMLILRLSCRVAWNRVKLKFYGL